MSKKSIVVADLANDEEVELTWSMFIANFVVPTCNEVPEIENSDEVERWEKDLGDCGVDRMKMKSSEELSAMLGFPDGRPATWSCIRSTDPVLNPWDHPERFPGFTDEQTDSGTQVLGHRVPDNCQSLQLLWHQLCGIASMVEKTFVDKEKSDMPGIILADAVGVGKTAQIMGYIAFLQLVYRCERPGSVVPRPSLIGMSSFRYSLWLS